jgi:hypothetical protein
MAAVGDLFEFSGYHASVQHIEDLGGMYKDGMPTTQ